MAVCCCSWAVCCCGKVTAQVLLRPGRTTWCSAVRGPLTLPAEHQVCGLETCAGASNHLPSGLRPCDSLPALCTVQLLSEAQKQFGEARRWVEQGAHLLASPQKKVRQQHAGKQCSHMTCSLVQPCHSLGLFCCCIANICMAVYSRFRIKPCWLKNQQPCCSQTKSGCSHPFPSPIRHVLLCLLARMHYKCMYDRMLGALAQCWSCSGIFCMHGWRTVAFSHGGSTAS